jgi:hypothetical protein
LGQFLKTQITSIRTIASFGAVTHTTTQI